MFAKTILLLIIFLWFIPIDATQTSMPIIELRCGSENQSLPAIRFAGLNQVRDEQLRYEQVYDTNGESRLSLTSPSVVVVELEPLEVRSPRPLQLSDGTLVYLSFIPEGNFTTPWRVNVLQPEGGRLLLLPEQMDPLFVLRLLDERRPGVFGVIGYTDDYRVFMAEITIADQGLTLGTPQFFELTHIEDGSRDAYLLPSPDGHYIFHTQILQLNGEYKHRYVIYDTQQQTMIWEHAYVGGYPRVIWTNDADLIALVGFNNDNIVEVSGHLLGIYQDGRSQLLLDVENLYGNDHFIGMVGGVPVAGDQVAMWISQPQIDQAIDDQLVLFNYQTGELTDLCITANQSTLYTDASGEYLLFNASLIPTESRLMLVSVTTGDYRYFTSEEHISVIPNTFEIMR